MNQEQDPVQLGIWKVIPIEAAHRAWLQDFWIEHWGAAFVITRGQSHHCADLPGFLMVAAGDRPPQAGVEPPIAGVVTYTLANGECEVVSLDSLAQRQGVGSALLEAVRQVAEAAGCRRLWLVTTNDNLPALGFYQRRGFRLVAVHANAIDQTRRLKPTLPLTGLDGIPLRDELELEMQLTPAKTPEIGLDAPGAVPVSAIQPDPSAAPLPGSSGYAQPNAVHIHSNPAGTCLARRPVYESRWVNLYLDHMRTPSGREIHDFHILDYPNPAVAMYVTNDRGEVLLGRYPRYTIGQVRWEVPAGGIEPGEDLLAAAQREVMEETGYTLTDPQHFYTYHPQAGSNNKVFHLVRARAGERTGTLDPHEVEQIRWFSVAELRQMIERQELQDGYTLTALLLAWMLHP